MILNLKPFGALFVVFMVASNATISMQNSMFYLPKNKKLIRTSILTIQDVKNKLKIITSRSNDKHNCLADNISLFQWLDGQFDAPEKALELPLVDSFHFKDLDTDKPWGRFQNSHDREKLSTGSDIHVPAEDNERLSYLIRAPILPSLSLNTVKAHLTTLPLKDYRGSGHLYAAGLLCAARQQDFSDCHFFGYYVYKRLKRKRQIYIIDTTRGRTYTVDNFIKKYGKYYQEKVFIWANGPENQERSKEKTSTNEEDAAKDTFKKDSQSEESKELESRSSRDSSPIRRLEPPPQRSSSANILSSRQRSPRYTPPLEFNVTDFDDETTASLTGETRSRSPFVRNAEIAMGDVAESRRSSPFQGSRSPSPFVHDDDDFPNELFGASAAFLSPHNNRYFQSLITESTKERSNTSLPFDIQQLFAELKPSFNREKFLHDYAEKFLSLPKTKPEKTLRQAYETWKTLTVNDKTDQYNEETNDLCWKAFFALAKHYKENPIEKAFAYEAMLKFFLTYDVIPKARAHDYSDNKGKAKYMAGLVNDLQSLVKNNKDVSQKWFPMYHGQFLLYRAHGAAESKKSKFLNQAYEKYLEAIAVKTTRIAYLLAAEVILVHGHVPEGFTLQEGRDLAHEHIRQALIVSQSRGKSKSTHSSHTQQPTSFTKELARPLYMTGLKHAVQKNVLPLLGKTSVQSEQMIVEIEQSQVNDVRYVEPGNHHQDAAFAVTVIDSDDENEGRAQWVDVIIPRHENEGTLPARQKLVAPRENDADEREIFEIDGKEFFRQNVSGADLRCFFNATGLFSDQVTTQLLQRVDDPVLRFMIANEITGTAHNAAEIPESVKRAIQFERYSKELEAINALEHERLVHLNAQGVSADKTDLSSLPPHLRDVDHNQPFEDLHKRARSASAFNEFVQHQFARCRYMIALLDVRNNGDRNLSSIDAIAYANNFGVKIYLEVEGALQLSHSFVPANATEIAYLYNANDHFQALLPVREDSQRQEASQLMREDEEDSSPKESNDDEVITENSSRDESEASAEWATPSKKRQKLPAEVKEICLQAYLENYEDMRNKRVGAKALVAELMKYLEKHSEELKRPFVPQIKLIKFFATLLGLMKKEEPMEEIGDEKITEIVDAYERGSSISKLMKKFAINYTAIFDILHENASPESIVKLALKPKRSFTKVDRENCILRAQQKLIDQGKEATPTAIETEIMNEYGPGVACYSTIARYFTQSTRAARANLTTLEKIKSDYERLTANGQRISYTKLARKHGVPVRQVERLLKKPPKQFNTLLERETHRGMIIDAFHALSPNEQLSKPTAIIARKLGVSSHIVRNDLMAAKLLIPKKRRPQSGNKYSNPLKRKNGDEPPRATKRSKH